MVGDRRIGKSSVLKTWEGKLKDRGAGVRWLSGEGPERKSINAFTVAITGNHSPEDPEGAADVLGVWAKKFSGPFPPVLLMDEAEYFFTHFDRAFFERMRGIMGEGKIAIVCSTRTQVHDIFLEQGQTSPFMNLLDTRYLGLLETAEAEAVIGWADLPEEEKTALREWAGRHPFFLQLLGQYFVDAKRTGENQESALDGFRNSAEGHFKALWQHCTDLEKEILKNPGQYTRGALRKLRTRGLVTEDGVIFGKVFEEWILEQI